MQARPCRIHSEAGLLFSPGPGKPRSQRLSKSDSTRLSPLRLSSQYAAVSATCSVALTPKAPLLLPGRFAATLALLLIMRPPLRCRDRVSVGGAQNPEQHQEQTRDQPSANRTEDSCIPSWCGSLLSRHASRRANSRPTRQTAEHQMLRRPTDKSKAGLLKALYLPGCPSCTSAATAPSPRACMWLASLLSPELLCAAACAPPAVPPWCACCI